MKIVQTVQVTNEDFSSLSIDAFVCSSGFESRSIFAAKFFESKLKTVPLKFYLGFEANQTLNRSENDKFFSNSGFTFIPADGDSSIVISQLIQGIISLLPQERIAVAFDYSCMTRVWYAEILNFFKNLGLQKHIEIYFIYSYARYVKPPELSRNNIHVGPIKGYSGLSIPNRPTALIIGLGYEKKRAFGLTEYFDAETFLFIADGGKASKFSKDVKRINSKLIEMVGLEKTFLYPIENLTYSEFQLLNLCRDIKDKYRVILAPCGPKPFTLLCLIVALKLDEIDVWRISPGSEADPQEKKADGDVSIYMAKFT